MGASVVLTKRTTVLPVVPGTKLCTLDGRPSFSDGNTSTVATR